MLQGSVVLTHYRKGHTKGERWLMHSMADMREMKRKEKKIKCE